MQGNGAGYLSVTGNMQKANRCTLSIFNFGSMLVSTLSNFFALRVKKDAQMLEPPGRRPTPQPLQSDPEGSQGVHASRVQNIPNPPEPTALWGILQSLGTSCFPTAHPPRRPVVPPRHTRIYHHSWGRKGIWLEVSWGSTWRSNQMAFTAAPLLPGILKQDLPTGACKRAG